MSRFTNRRDPLLWDAPSHLHRRDKNDPAREVTLFNRLLRRNYLKHTASGKQEAVLKIVSNAMGKAALTNVVEYIARTADYMEDESPLTLEDETGSLVLEKEEQKEIISDWGTDFESPTAYKEQAWKVEVRKQLDYERAKLQYYAEKRDLDRSEKKHLKEVNLALKEEKVRAEDGSVVDFHIYAPKDTTHIILSVGGTGHNSKRANEATRRFLREGFEAQGYRYMFVMHDDTDNLHFHVILKNRNELTGKYIQFDKADLFTLRHEFAHHLDRMGIKRVATLRRDRVVTLKAIQEQKEQLFERHATFKEKQSEKKPINVQKYRTSVLKRTESLLRNVEIERTYSKLTPSRNKQLKKLQVELTSFKKELKQNERQLTPDRILQDQSATVTQLSRETAKLKRKPSTVSRQQKKNMKKYLAKFEDEISYAIKYFKAQTKYLTDNSQKQRTASAITTLQKLHKQTIKLRHGYGYSWKLGL